MTTAVPTYFGATDRARFGFLHWPVGSVVGGAVVCPPLGYEDVCAHTALRHLAERLAASGIATLRIDYDGSGNSMGRETDPDRVAAWFDSIHDAIQACTGWGLPPVTLIGLRFGATLAANVAAGNDRVDATVLWDPVGPGRRYGRALRMLATPIDPDVRSSEGVSVAGTWFADATLAEIGALTIDPDRVTCPTLAVLRPDPEREAQRWVTGASESLEVRIRAGMRELIDVDAELAVVPESVVAEISTWIVDRTRARSGGSRLTSMVPVPQIRPRTEELLGPDVIVTHRVRRVSDAELFVVDTARTDATPTRALITLNNGVARSIGPGGAWVDVARDAAATGWRVVRMDLSGIGDSPPRAGADENNSYPLSAATDVGAVVADLRADGIESVSLIGLCSGALLSFDAVLEVPEIDTVVSINGRFDAVFSEPRVDRSRRAAGHTNRLIGIPLRKTPLFPYFEKVPGFLWAGLARLHLVASPVEALESALERGVRVAMVFGPDEWGLRALRRRAGKRFRKVAEHPMTTLIEVSRLDHSMFDPEARSAVLGFLLPFLGSGDAAPRTLAPTSA